VFLSEQNVVYVGSGVGKTAWLMSTLTQLNLNIFAFERYVPNYEASARTLLEVRSHPKVHKLQVASFVYSVSKYTF
jgi:protein-L-isoaspartate O-methyltransferase